MQFNEKQIQILKIAERLFAEQGFDGTSIRNIAKEAGINIAMISYYFGSKEKLLEALLLYRLSDFRLEVKSVLDSEGTYLDKLDAMIVMIVKRIHKNRHTHKIINFEYSNSSRQIDFQSYIEQKKESIGLVKTFIIEGQKKGAFTKKANLDLIMPTVLGTYFHFYYNKLYYRNLFNLKNETEVDIYVHNTLTQHIQQTIKALLTYEG